ncbi:MAG: trehalose-6-phosphate synthase [Nocardiopsaceae bacterium]|nr:trehalose-6-phosphate synthase [Nocardiopsaceae bacterium]
MINDPSRLVLVASNRGPVSFGFTEDGTLSAKRGGGGMVSGLTSGLAAIAADGGVLWVAAALSDADREAARHGAQADGGPGDAPVRLLDIPADTLDAAYNRVSNSVLWFVHHLLFATPSQPRFDQAFRRDWAAYAAYNEAFAAALADESGKGTSVLVQDYHLALVPRLLRDRGTGARIAHFQHTPWAPPEYFRMLPDEVATQLLDGMLGADHAGFLSGRWAGAFLDCCEEVLGARVSRAAGTPAAGTPGVGTSVAGTPGVGTPAAGTLAAADGGVAGRVTHRGHVTEVAVHPLGVDTDGLRARASADDVRAHVRALREQAADRQLIVRVDRTELSKNIVRGLAAYAELLATRPQWRGRVTHLAFAYPSRSGLAEYQAYTRQVSELAQAVNEEFRTPGWEPVVLEVKDDYARSLAACTVADVLLINPIRDGMNLVAEEGPILSERGCALVLSREAGAADLFGEHSLLVNPYDVTETADALHAGLSMSPEERRRRSAVIAEAAAARAPRHWLGEQLAALR